LPLEKIEIDNNIIAQKALNLSLNCHKDIISLKKENNELKQQVKDLTSKIK
jgi:cell division protein FtsB